MAQLWLCPEEAIHQVNHRLRRALGNHEAKGKFEGDGEMGEAVHKTIIPWNLYGKWARKKKTLSKSGKSISGFMRSKCLAFAQIQHLTKTQYDSSPQEHHFYSEAW